MSPPDSTFRAALAAFQAGRLPDAEKLCRALLATQSHHADALHLLGVISAQSGQLDPAIILLRRALAIQPANHMAHNNLGRYLQASGRLDEALASFRRALQLHPNFADAHHNLGLALRQNHEPQLAAAAIRRALEIRPDHAIALSNLGLVLQDQGLLDEAIASFRQASAVDPRFAEAHHNLGTALQSAGHVAEAVDSFRAAISLRPDFVEAHANLALALLLLGDFPGGWPEHEWRFKMKSLPPERHAAHPRWDGSAAAGRTILLYAEQGFGDTLMFVRYVPQVAARGLKVLFACQPELARLLANFPGVHQFIPSNAPAPQLQFDLQCPLASLPLAFRTTLETIPAATPYITPDPALVAHWRERITQAESGPSRLRVGLTWAGNPQHRNDARRSLTLAQLAPLFEVPDVTFYSLQKGTRAEQLPNGPHLIDMTPDLTDFADTAALIAHLDLVISVDTSIVHLAGAMAKPVFVLLPFLPDWRWLLGRTDSPWYPTAQFFRQPAPGDWATPIASAAARLANFGSP